VTRLVTRLDIGRLNRLIGELRVPEVRADQQAQAEQHHWKTEQCADQLARHSRRPADGTCFPTFSSVTVRAIELRMRVDLDDKSTSEANLRDAKPLHAL